MLQIMVNIKKLDFMQILCHRKDPKVRKEIKMLGKGGGKNNKLGWGIYSPVLHVRTFFLSILVVRCLGGTFSFKSEARGTMATSGGLVVGKDTSLLYMCSSTFQILRVHPVLTAVQKTSVDTLRNPESSLNPFQENGPQNIGLSLQQSSEGAME